MTVLKNLDVWLHGPGIFSSVADIVAFVAIVLAATDFVMSKIYCSTYYFLLAFSQIFYIKS